MGIQSGSLSLCRYRVLGAGKTKFSLKELNALLENFKSSPIKLTGVKKEELSGWVRPIGIDKITDDPEAHWDLSHSQADEGFLLRMRLEKRKVPVQLLQLIYKQKHYEETSKSAKPISPKGRKELKEAVKLDLTGRALPQIAHVDAYWRDRTGELMLFGTGKKLRETFETLFQQTFAAPLGLTLVRVEPPLLGLNRQQWEDSGVASETLGRLSLATPISFAAPVHP